MTSSSQLAGAVESKPAREMLLRYPILPATQDQGPTEVEVSVTTCRVTSCLPPALESWPRSVVTMRCKDHDMLCVA